jgi:hypothetical protein
MITDAPVHHRQTVLRLSKCLLSARNGPRAHLLKNKLMRNAPISAAQYTNTVCQAVGT